MQPLRSALRAETRDAKSGEALQPVDNQQGRARHQQPEGKEANKRDRRAGTMRRGVAGGATATRLSAMLCGTVEYFSSTLCAAATNGCVAWGQSARTRVLGHGSKVSTYMLRRFLSDGEACRSGQ